VIYDVPEARSYCGSRVNEVSDLDQVTHRTATVQR